MLLQVVSTNVLKIHEIKLMCAPCRNACRLIFICCLQQLFVSLLIFVSLLKRLQLSVEISYTRGVAGSIPDCSIIDVESVVVKGKTRFILSPTDAPVWRWRWPTDMLLKEFQGRVERGRAAASNPPLRLYFCRQTTTTFLTSKLCRSDGAADSPRRSESL